MIKTPEEIRSLLRTVDTGITVTFTKADGTTRAMKATLFPELLPQVEAQKPTETKVKENPDTVRVFDLEKNAWRSFRYDSVIEITTNFN
jgi:hypothetical protein